LRARAEYAVFFGFIVLVAVLGFRARPRQSGHRPAILSAAPRDAWLVITVDVPALRESALGRALLGSAGGTGAGGVPGLGTVASTCGFDPLASVREVMVVAPEDGDRGDFGIAFSGDLAKDDLVGCAKKVIGARGGRTSESSRGSFTVIDGLANADPNARRTRFAYRTGGPFLVSRGSWLDAMIDGVEGRVERAPAEHDALRAVLSPGESPSPAVVVTALLPKALRERIKSEMGAELGVETDRAFQAVLAVDAAGLSVVTGGGPTTEVRLELRCETPGACGDVQALIQRKRRVLRQELGLRLVGLASLLDGLAVTTDGAALLATMRAPTSELAQAVDRLMLGVPPSIRPSGADAAGGRLDAGDMPPPGSDPNRQPGIGGL
jgi:hypothetical protein